LTAYGRDSAQGRVASQGRSEWEREMIGFNEVSEARRAAWTAAAPLACAAHCLAMPAVIAVVPALAPAAEIEWLLFVLTAAVMAGVMAWSGRVHRRWPPAAVAALGLAIWFASLAGWFGALPEPATTLAGSIVAAGALLWNATLLHRATCEDCCAHGCGSPRKAGSALP
jgi:hypothetical protein